MPNKDLNTNEVIVNGQVIMTTRNDTVTPQTLVKDETATNKEGAKIVGELDPVSHNEAYLIDDPESDIDDSDYIPFNDVSDEEQPKKKTLFSSIVDKLKTIFVSKSWEHVELLPTTETLGIKDKEVDATASNNGVTANHYPSSNDIRDNNNKIIARSEAIVYPNGTITAKMYAQNYDTNGNSVGQNAINLNVDKLGAFSYNVSDPNAFRSAIKTVDQLGTDIPENADLNTYKTAGTYRVPSDGIGATISNLPLALCGKVVVFNNGNGGFEQFYFPNHSPRIFVRTWWSDAWSAWKELGEGGDSKTHTYERGTPIPENSDLDTYLTQGVYFVGSDVASQTISNVPVQSAGKLIVVESINSSNYRIQMYQTLTGRMWVRYYSLNESGWHNWKELASTDDTYLIKNGRYNSLISENDDLNTYTTGGTYDCIHATTAVTLTNCPVSVAFKLMVDVENNPNILTQTITIINEKNTLPWRRGRDSSGSWGTWKQLASTDDLKPHTYEVGTSIPASSDLNTYIIDGVYKIAPDATAQTIVNIPSHGNTITGGKLVVSKGYSANENYIIQTYYSNDNYIFVRRSTDSGTTWFAWKQLASIDDVSPSTVGDGYAVATVSGSAITATISGFKLRAGVIVALKISNYISTACTLNINSTGAKQVLALNNSQISEGYPIVGGYVLYTFMYDGTNYRILSWDATPSVQTQNYVADTSGNILMNWGYDVNRAQIKYNLSNNKLVWNYYRNSAWRGDYNIVDEYGHQTMVGWLGLKTNGGRTIASGAHSLAVSDTIPNILNELRFSNGAWGSLSLNTAYTLNGTTIPTGWYNYFYMPHRVGGENWAKPTSWDGDNVNYGTLMLFGMNNTHGVFKVRMNPVDGSYVPVEVVKMADQNDTGASVAKVGKSILPSWGYTANTKTTNGITYTFNPATGEITANGTATADSYCILASANMTSAEGCYPYKISKGQYVITGCPSGGSNSKYKVFLQITSNSSHLTFDDYGNGCNVNFTSDASSEYTGTFYESWGIMVRSGQTLTNLVFKPMLRPAFTTSEYEPCEDIHKGNCYVGTCTTAGATKDKVAYVDGYFVLRKGVRVAIKFSNSNTYNSQASSPITLNVNNTGAKNIWWNNNHTGAVNHGTNTVIFGVANRYVSYIYDGTYWVWDGESLEENSTYTPQSLGFGYGTCTTAEATTAKLVTLANYNLISGGYVTVRFDYNVPANATMNINSKGAKGIYYHGTAIKAGIIKAGDRATFVYDGTNYQLVGIDRISCGRENCIGFSHIKFGQVASTLVNTANSHVRGEIIGGVLYFNMELRFSASGTLPSYSNTAGGIFMIPNITAYAFRMAHGEYGNNYVPCYVNTMTYDGSTGLMFMLRNQLAVNTSSTLKISFEIPITNGVAF